MRYPERDMIPALLLFTALVSCRTATSSAEKESKPQLPLSGQTSVTSTDKTPLLKKVLGALTQKYPENRQEECVIYASDVTDVNAVNDAIRKLKNEELSDAFIFRPQIPSIQYFGFDSTDAVLLQESGDEKFRFRRAEGEIGNPAMESLMVIFDSKCGEKDAGPG